MAPESRVDCAELAESLELSVTPLREALRRLEAERLVVRSAHREVVVTPLTYTEAKELLAVREEMDTVAAKWACQQMTTDEIRGAKALIAGAEAASALEYLKKAQVGATAHGRLAVNRAFHRMVYCGSHNHVLIEAMDALTLRSERYAIAARERVSREDGEVTRTYDPHRALHTRLIAAIEIGDIQDAEEAVREHYVGPNFVDALFGGEHERSRKLK